MAGGQQINVGQGFVEAPGEAIEDTISGEQVALLQGSFPNSELFVRLRSRKVGSASAEWPLLGQKIDASGGLLAKAINRGVSGSLIGSGQGVVVGSVPQSGLLVDEVAADANLLGHPDVYWYSGSTVPCADWWSNGCWAGQNATVLFNAIYNTNVIRWGSRTQADCTPGVDPDCVTIQSWRKWCNSNTWGASNAPAIGNTPIPQAYFRWMIRLDPDVAAGMTEHHLKLSGLEGWESSGGLIEAFIFGYAKPVSGTAELTKYGLRDSPDGAVNVDHESFTPKRYLTLGTWHCLEMFKKLNSTPNTFDAEYRAWLDDVLIEERTNFRWYRNTPANGVVEINHVRGQLFHGGQVTVPSAEIHHEQFGWCLATRRIGKAKPAPAAPTLSQDINNNSWASTWNALGQQVNQTFSTSYLDSQTKQCLEFTRGQHSVTPGYNTGVRWADFTATNPPTGGYYWSNDDTNIVETDNLPSLFIPWNRWCWVVNTKIIDLDGPTAVHQNQIGPGDFWSTHHELILGTNIDTPKYSSQNFDPASITNPGASDVLQMYFGGGYGSGNTRAAQLPAMKLMKPNPNYPTDSRALQLKVWFYNADAPLNARHAPRVGNYVYWGGAHQDDNNGNQLFNRVNRFYRINMTTLEAAYNTFGIPQERIADCPLAGGDDGYYSLLVADEIRQHLIYINNKGVYRYLIANNSWEGPFTFGLGSSWQSTLQDGASQWWGCCGVHRADLNKTFFRHNTSKKWHRINW